MPKLLPTCGYPTLADFAEAMVAEGMPEGEIARRAGRQPVQIRAALSHRRHAKSPRTVVLPIELFRALGPAALARGIDVPALVLRLLETIAEDDAVDALLDEPEGGQDG